MNISFLKISPMEKKVDERVADVCQLHVGLSKV